MNLDAVEQWVRWAGAVAVAVVLAAIFAGLAQASCRPRGRATGQARAFLRWPVYVLLGVAYFGLCFLLWRPLPLALPASARIAALAAGSLLYFPGLALVLWARLTLGQMYNVSSGFFGVQLYANHRLVTHGPFAIVRHPMYLGISLASLGGLLIYRTWTFVFALTLFGLVVRARREEHALAAEFGEEWEAYRRRVPGWVPRILRRQ